MLIGLFTSNRIGLKMYENVLKYSSQTGALKHLKI